MKHRYKILVGEWVSVYSTQTLVVDTDKKIDNMTAEQLARLLDEDDGTSFEVAKEDFDWSTEEHEDWDRNGEFKILDKQELTEAKNER